MQTIRVLDELTINKIAAGEVIENPASVVKELIDNAIDAKASLITIDIKQGGRTLISVRDNGVGMNRDDAILCLERHATSKITDVEDLFHIDTMGFRGEAVPSIAAISRFSIHTMKEGKGTLLYVEGGKLLTVEEQGKTPGTTIEVKDLFFNVPVRRKFQKSPAYDANEVLKMVMRLSLANPSISFELTSDNEVVLKANASSEKSPQEQLEERIRSVLGSDFVEEAVPIHAEAGGMSLYGFLGTPLASKPNRLSQHLFINRRPVFSPFIAECIRESYAHALPQGKFPLFVLHLFAPKDLIDINVHPQKKEVRLRHFEQFKSAILKAVQSALFGKAPSMEEMKSSFAVHAFPLECTKKPFMIREEEAEAVFMPAIMMDEREIQPELFSRPFPEKPVFNILFVAQDIALIKGSFKAEENALFTLIDLKAAKETVLYNALNEKQIGPLAPLLIPYTFTLDREESRLLKENLSELEKSGIPVREFGEGSFCLEGLPSSFGDIALDIFINDLIESLAEQKGVEGLFTKKVIRSVMRSSQGSSFTPEEVRNIASALHALGAPLYSPSGKSIYAAFDNAKAKKVIGTL